ncbi:MAG: DUF1427 family protein [Firmicutes bacterium]|nr:DUF1427 family protein [Bacillota bacterium]
MKELFAPLATGMIVGGVFALLKLPIPAPPTLSGVAGILGILFGYQLMHRFLG